MHWAKLQFLTVTLTKNYLTIENFPLRNFFKHPDYEQVLPQQQKFE